MTDNARPGGGYEEQWAVVIGQLQIDEETATSYQDQQTWLNPVLGPRIFTFADCDDSHYYFILTKGHCRTHNYSQFEIKRGILGQARLSMAPEV